MTRTTPTLTLPQAHGEQLAASFHHCKQVARQRARNFYYGMKLMPEPKRSAMHAIYAWMRAADDLADGPAPSEASRTQRIEAFRRTTHAALAGQTVEDDDAEHAAIWPAVCDVFRTYRIRREHLDAMIDGQLLDQRKTRYAGFAELHDYCYKVASTVGLVCLQVWGNDGQAETFGMAEDRGVALQLTNILRDLVEDAGRDRVYLPADELTRFGFDAESFKAFVLGGGGGHIIGRPSGGRGGADFDGLMSFQIERARGHYRRSMPLESRLSAECRPTCWAMVRIYERLLEKIARDPRRVLRGRVRLSSFAKLRIALRATWRRGVKGG